MDFPNSNFPGSSGVDSREVRLNQSQRSVTGSAGDDFGEKLEELASQADEGREQSGGSVEDAKPLDNAFGDDEANEGSDENSLDAAKEKNGMHNALFYSMTSAQLPYPAHLLTLAGGASGDVAKMAAQMIQVGVPVPILSAGQKSANGNGAQALLQGGLLTSSTKVQVDKAGTGAEAGLSVQVAGVGQKSAGGNHGQSAGRIQSSTQQNLENGGEPAKNAESKLLANSNSKSGRVNFAAEAAESVNKQTQVKVIQENAPRIERSSLRAEVETHAPAKSSGERAANSPAAPLPAATGLNGPNGQMANQLKMVTTEAELAKAGAMQSNSSAGSGEGDRSRGDSNQSSLLSGSSIAKLDTSVAQKPEAVRIFISRMDSAVQQMQMGKVSNVQLQVSLEKGERFKIRLSLRGTKLNTVIHTENENLRSVLRTSWLEVVRSLAEKGVQAGNLEFDSSTDGGKYDDGQGFDEGRQTEFAQAGQKQRQSDAGEAIPVGSVVTAQTSRIFSRIA